MRFQQDLHDNRIRTQALFDEAAAISNEMRRRGISFALLKGITLAPDSVPDPALRWQIDLDLLVAAGEATAARQVLMNYGYALHAVCGNSMEFKAGRSGTPDIRNIYRLHSQRSLELHMLSTTAVRDSVRADRLSRIQLRDFGGTVIPTLSPADILVQQSLHLLKHLCGEHTRASWVLEFWRHVQARRGDTAFWREVERIAAMEPQGILALGASLFLSSLMLGGIAQDEFAQRLIIKLPHNIHLWLETFGMRVLFADSPGNKLYLILRQELRGNAPSRPAIRTLIFPAHLPPAVTHGHPGERPREKLRRYRTEIWFFLSRLHFHIVEGLRYAMELSRWQRRLAENSR